MTPAPWSRLILVVALLVLAAPPARGQTGVAPPWTRAIDAHIEETMTRQSIPGVQLAIAENGRVIYSKGYGVADVETGRKVTPSALFQVGSVAKAMTGLLLAQLAVEDVVDLRAPITGYVPELRGQVGAVTTYQLLTHSAGWGDRVFPLGRTDDAALGESMRQATDDWLLTTPGRVFSYSNPGFSMAGYVAERATDKPFVQLVEERLLARFSRDHATYRPLVAMTREIALGHEKHPHDGSAVVVRPMPGNSGEYPAGFLYITAADLVRFGAALMNGGTLDDARMVSEEAVRMATAPGIASPRVPDTRAGLGLDVAVQGGERVWRKSGSVNGYASDLAMWPDRKLAVAVSINNWMNRTPRDLTSAAAHIARGVALGPPEQVHSERVGSGEERGELVGRYRNSGSAIVEIVEVDGALQFRGVRGTYPVLLKGGDGYVVKRPDRSVEGKMIRNANGAVEFLHVDGRALVKLMDSEVP